jgi:1,4-alpha-glucan branching enzyme
MNKNIPKLVKDDPWLEPYAEIISGRIAEADKKETELTGNQSLSDFATGYLFFGLHKIENEWIIREWLPNATHIYLIGTFNDWQEKKEYEFKFSGNGVWELKLAETALNHGDLYALSVHWAINLGKRIPAWATRVVQDSSTHIFNAQVWSPENPYQWKNPDFRRNNEPLLIYEAHIGMAGEEERVHTYTEFREEMLPRIKANGYNTIQLMAIPNIPITEVLVTMCPVFLPHLQGLEPRRN